MVSIFAQGGRAKNLEEDVLRKLLCALSVLALAFSGCGDSDNAVFTGGTFVGGGNSVANDDAFSTFGNAQISVSAQEGLLANDTIDGDVVAAASQPANGTVVVNSDGSFTYSPVTGFRGPTDSFNYSLTNGSAATVTISFSGVAWFVDSSAAAGDADGSLVTPFTTTAQAQAASQPGDIIFLFFGNGTPYGPVVLQNNQQLIGQTAGLVAAQTIVPPAGRPVITNNSGDGVTLANGNTLRGIDIANTSGSGVFGNNISGLTLDDVVCRNAGNRGIHVELLSGTFDFDGVDVRSSVEDNFFLPGCSGTGTIDGCTSAAAGDDGLDMDALSGSVVVSDCEFAGDQDDSVDFFETAGTATIQGSRFVSPGENCVEIGDGMGGTVTINDCQLNSPGLEGVCLFHEESGTLNAVITNCTIFEPGSHGVLLDCFDSGPANVTIQGNNIDAPSFLLDFSEGIHCIFEENVVARLLILDNVIEDGFDQGCDIEVYDASEVDCLIDNNTFRDNGDEGLQVYVEDALLNIGITNNVFDNNDTFSCAELDSGTMCARFNDNDYSNDDDDFEFIRNSGTLNLETPSGNNPGPPDESGTVTPVGAGTCTDIPTRP